MKMRKNGMTLVEIMITIAVTAILMLGIVTFWVMISKSWTGERLKSHLSQQVEVGIERMKKEMRLSSADPNAMVFYGDPSTVNPPYEAISMPIPAYSNTSTRTLDRISGNLNWSTTVAYHVYTNTNTNITELRRTVFNNRANLTQAQREAQLSTVVSNGDGTSASQGSETASTEVVFTNLVTLQIEGASKFDGYNPSSDGVRSNNVEFGSILLTPGVHNMKFKLVSKNPSSTGYGLGIDCISLTPSGAPKEGEDYFSSATCSTGTKQIEDMFNNTNNVWSGNSHMEFSSSSTDSYIVFPIYYDEWRETNFENGTIDWQYTKRDQTIDHDYIIRLEGNETAWNASSQAGGDKTDDTVTRENKYIRIVISKDCLSCSGSAAKVKFSSHSEHPLKILSAYFGISDSNNPQNFDTAKMTPVQLTFGSPAANEVTIPANSSAQTNWFKRIDASTGMPPVIDRNADPKVDYLVSFHIDTDSANANCSVWKSESAGSGTANSYIFSGSGTGHEIDNWVLTISSPDIYAVGDIFASYAANATCTSQIYDTTINDASYPQYQSLTASSTIPTDTSVSLEIRSSDNSDMSGATAWCNPAGISGINGKQYVQFKTTLQNTAFPYIVTPEVKSVYVNWNPASSTEKRLVDVSGYFTMRPDYGVFEVLIDDTKLIRGIDTTMDIRGNVSDSEYSSHITAEVYPRNTGK